MEGGGRTSGVEQRTVSVCSTRRAATAAAGRSASLTSSSAAATIAATRRSPATGDPPGDAPCICLFSLCTRFSGSAATGAAAVIHGLTSRLRSAGLASPFVAAHLQALNDAVRRKLCTACGPGAVLDVERICRRA